MNDLAPYVVEMPSCGSIDDLWRIEFRTGGRLHWINNASERIAHVVLRMWRRQEPSRLICCNRCPEGEHSPCPHDERPEQRGWRFTEITEMRIMPMREAV